MSNAIKIDVSGQPLNLLSFDTLVQLYDYSNPIQDWFQKRYFSDERYLHGQDKVPVGEIKSYIPIAPAVLPTSQGRVISSKIEANVKYVKAPYFKPAEVVTPSDDVSVNLTNMLKSLNVIANSAGSNVPLSLSDEWQVAAMQAFGKLRYSLSGRINLMCRDALLYGKVEIDDDDFDFVTVDFGRHPDLKFTPAIKWGETDATPYQDQRQMVKLLVKHGKRRPVDAIMSSRVFDSFVDDEEFNEKFTAAKDTNATRVFSGTFGGEIEATLRGTVDGIEYWTYDAEYDTGIADEETERLIPEDGFWFISEPNNRLYYCKIVHRQNPQKLAMQYFPYHVSNDNPSVDEFLLDSSPLPVPINKNGACGGVGFINL